MGISCNSAAPEYTYSHAFQVGTATLVRGSAVKARTLNMIITDGINMLRKVVLNNESGFYYSAVGVG
ncbi:hypothetical protein TNCV_4824551 [Trichonephila clavipes]|nr:hypothetical protein TNCV_4824551 [Trichonephila clavipes]